jgi:hypothetical protein
MIMIMRQIPNRKRRDHCLLHCIVKIAVIVHSPGGTEKSISMNFSGPRFERRTKQKC